MSNSFSEPVGIAIEPWGDQYMIPPGQAVRLEIEGPTGGVPEIAIEPGGVTVFAWDGSTCAGFVGEAQVLHGEIVFPPGMDKLRRLGLFGDQHRTRGDA